MTVYFERRHSEGPIMEYWYISLQLYTLCIYCLYDSEPMSSIPVVPVYSQTLINPMLWRSKHKKDKLTHWPEINKLSLAYVCMFQTQASMYLLCLLLLLIIVIIPSAMSCGTAVDRWSKLTSMHCVNELQLCSLKQCVNQNNLHTRWDKRLKMKNCCL